ncbi:MAG: hypothetical protein ABH870_04060 [bacterium]
MSKREDTAIIQDIIRRLHLTAIPLCSMAAAKLYCYLECNLV